MANAVLKSAVLVDAVRSPSGKGKPGGQLAHAHPVDLFATMLEALVDRTGIDPGTVDDVIGGCLSQVGRQAVNITRSAVLAAGFPETVPATTVDRQCGSSQQAVTFAAQGIMSGNYDVVIAGGVELMSSNPINSATLGQDYLGPKVGARYPGGLVGQGISAELIAARWGMSRERLDAFAALSHERAAAAQRDGLFDGELVHVDNAAVDETVRPSTTPEGLATLTPAFRDDDLGARFPEIEWKITAGNSSPLTDGASAVLMMSEDAAARYGLRPRAKFHSFAVTGFDPIEMLTGVIPVTRRILEKSGLAIGDIDIYEVNEAFACVPLAWLDDLDADPDKLNVLGGAISLGHALGSSGTRLLTTMVTALETTGGRYGLQVMCEGAGMANATIIERLS